MWRPMRALRTSYDEAAERCVAAEEDAKTSLDCFRVVVVKLMTGAATRRPLGYRHLVGQLEARLRSATLGRGSAFTVSCLRGRRTADLTRSSEVKISRFPLQSQEAGGRSLARCQRAYGCTASQNLDGPAVQRGNMRKCTARAEPLQGTCVLVETTLALADTGADVHLTTTSGPKLDPFSSCIAPIAGRQLL